MSRLEELLRIASPQELVELYAFWDGDGHRLPAGSDVAAALAPKMVDETLVRRRVRFLSRKLIDLLRFFLGRRQFEADFSAIRAARSFAVMSPHEVEAAVRALTKRGFLFQRVVVESEPIRFVVPTELGHVLQRELEDLDLELSASFSLKRMLQARAESAGTTEVVPASDAKSGLNGVVQGGATGVAKSVTERVAALPEEARDLYERTLSPGGGVLSRALAGRELLDPSGVQRRHLKEALEAQQLGTVRHLALGEYGINHFDETIVLFEEVLVAELDARSRVTPPPESRVRSLGVDLLSDLSLLLERLTRDKVKYTQGGQIYRAAAKKIEDELILCSKGDFDAEKFFNFLLDLALERHLMRRTTERTLELTAKGKTWPRLSVHFKLKELLAALLVDPGRAFHPPRLRKLALERLRELEPGRWYDFHLFIGAVRQRYLSQLDEAGLREAYQSRFQYSPEAHLRDLPQLGQVVAGFLVDELHLLGLVDLALDGARPSALCITPLAVKALGLSETHAVPARSRLLVNSDFEVLLLPEADSYDLIEQLDRFAERVTPQDAHRFRVTPRSIERAVAGGMSAAAILETLAAHSSSDLPQNVVFSVREHAEKVRFVSLRPVLLLTARHREVIDQLMKRPDLKKHVQERLGPRVIALQADAAEEVQALLAHEGVFLEGEVVGHESEVNGNPAVEHDRDQTPADEAPAESVTLEEAEQPEPEPESDLHVDVAVDSPAASNGSPSPADDDASEAATDSVNLPKDDDRGDDRGDETVPPDAPLDEPPS